MEENELEEKKQQQPPKRTYREVLAERNPELNLDDDDAVTGYLDESFTRYDESEKQRKQLNDLLAKDERAAGVLTGMATGVDEDGNEFLIESYLMDKYWDDINQDAPKEEIIAKIRKKESEMIKREAEKAAQDKQREENLKKTDEALTEAVNETNIDDATVAAMLPWIYGSDNANDGLVHKIIRNELSKEDWIRLIHAFNRDADMNGARKQGAAEARQAKRGSSHRDLSNVPTNLGSGGNTEGGGEEFTDPTIERLNKMKRKY